MCKQVFSNTLTDRVMDNLRDFALAGMPYEVCGVIHSHNIIHQYANTFAGDHKHGFDMEIDIKHCDIKAIWHSHPSGLNEPSSDDLAAMQELANHGYHFPWIIVTSKEVTEWVLEPSHVLAS